ncbi:putative hydrophobic seed protein [Helianthus anomalus]
MTKMNPSKPFTVVFILANVILLATVSANKQPCPPKTPTKCPKYTQKFGACGEWLGLVHEAIGAQPDSECCSLVKGLADLEAAACLCTALKVIKCLLHLVWWSHLEGKKVPEGFKL